MARANILQREVIIRILMDIKGVKESKFLFWGAMIACAISWMNMIVSGSDLVQRTLRKWEVFLSWVNIDKKYKYTKIRIYKYKTSENFEKAGGDPLPDQHLHRLHHRQLSHNKDHPKCLGDCSQVSKRPFPTKYPFFDQTVGEINFSLV